MSKQRLKSMKKSTYKVNPSKIFRTPLEKRHKYNVTAKDERTWNGVVYDSKKEMERAMELSLLERAGQIKNLQRQVSFVLQEKFRDNTGKTQRAITYVCDFMYEQDGETVVEDVKSRMTMKLPEYRLKKKMFLYKYPEYRFYENVR